MKVVVSALLSSHFDNRYVIIDEATGEVLDDADGYRYHGAHNGHRGHSYKSMPPKKNHQPDAVKRRVHRCCAHVQAILTEHDLELPLSVKDLMKHW